MSVDWVLLALRLISAGVLLGFLGAIFVVLWRDYRAAAGMAAERHRARLVVIRAGDGVNAVRVADGARYGTVEPDDTLRMPSYLAEALQAADLVGATFPLLPVTTLGRAPTNTIVLNDSFCSQEHALLARRGGQWWLEDLDSSNGTRLNGDPVTEPVVVSSGDVIGVGRVDLKVEIA